jgi:WD40 repeat protein
MPNRFSLMKESLHFAQLSGAIFLVLVALATGEAGVMWLGGFRYQPKGVLHEACISSLAVAADGQWAVSRTGFRPNQIDARVDFDVVWHDLKNSAALRLQIGKLAPEAVAISPLSGTVAIGCLDGSLYLWRPNRSAGVPTSEVNIGRPYLLGSLRGGSVINVAFSADDRFLVAVDRRDYYVWRARTGELLHRRAHGAGGYAVLAFRNQGRLLVCSGMTGSELCLWDCHTGRVRQTLQLDSTPTAVALSPSGKQLAAIDTDSALTVYNVHTGKALWSHMRKGSEGLGLVFTPDGKEISVGGAPGRISFYDSRTGERRAPLTQQAMVKGLTMAANGVLYSWDRNGEIRAWNLEHRQPMNGFSLLAWGRGERQPAFAGPVFDGGVLATVAPRRHRVASILPGGP